MTKLERANLAAGLALKLLAIAAILFGAVAAVWISSSLAEQHSQLPAYCYAGDARAASEVCHPK